ncbi:SIMPL domain-containing protein [Gordonia lacunae]|uniref:SIMPL domain-containing protein n=1 Tax=Gordonia lacunae TaxID=417102 RepID=A0A243QBU2_9ACTN|nr:SIMPL domain-containing protein [Gordonia lacunae]OUC79067.1 SIMPL domain-containing protein [Gordonia lacunae]
MTEHIDELEIVVRGNARGRYRPERGILHLVVRVEGPDKPAVYTRAVEVHTDLTHALADHETGGAVSRWTADSVRVCSYRPYSESGERRDLVYNTRIRIEAEFVDFERLSEFIDLWAAVDAVEIGDVDWDLREETRRDRERDLRRAAVDDAIGKAQAYSDAVGRGPVTPVLLSDPDMASGAVPSPRRAMPLAVAAGPPSSPSLDLRTDDIEIAVAVDARFRAH